MDLNAILEKTQKKASSSSLTSKKIRTFIATNDRPYDLSNASDKNAPSNEKNLTQTEHKPDTNLTQLEYVQNEKPTLCNDFLPSCKNQISAIKDENKGQLCATLVGLQRDLLFLLYRNSKFNHDGITEPLTVSHISDLLQCKKGSIKTTLRRLQNKEFIFSIKIKNGRGGWVQYRISPNIYSELLKLEASEKLNTKLTQFKNGDLDTPHAGVDKKDNNYDSNKTSLPDGWQSIDIEPLEEIKFTKSHLLQISKTGKTSPENLQQSIYHFSFDLRENNKIEKIKKTPIDYFMGILRREGIYNAPSNYVSEEEKALKIYLQNEENKKKRLANMEKSLFESEFEDWLSKLSPVEIGKILPDQVKNINLQGPKTSFLKKHFEEFHWSEIKKEKFPTITTQS